MKNLNNISVTDQPREKMLLHGPATLSETELLAILVAFGSRELPVIALCDKVLQSAQYDLEILAGMTLEEVCQIKGIGIAKGAIILAAMELGRRRISLQNKIPKIRNDSDAIRIVRPYFKDVKQRQFMLVLLNRNYELLAVSKLTLKDALPDIAQIIQLVVEAGAYSFGIVRNTNMETAEYLTAEKERLTYLGSAAEMLQLKYLGRVLIE